MTHRRLAKGKAAVLDVVCGGIVAYDVAVSRQSVCAKVPVAQRARFSSHRGPILLYDEDGVAPFTPESLLSIFFSAFAAQAGFGLSPATPAPDPDASTFSFAEPDIAAPSTPPAAPLPALAYLVGGCAAFRAAYPTLLECSKGGGTLLLCMPARESAAAAMTRQLSLVWLQRGRDPFVLFTSCAVVRQSAPVASGGGSGPVFGGTIVVGGAGAVPSVGGGRGPGSPGSGAGPGSNSSSNSGTRVSPGGGSGTVSPGAGCGIEGAPPTHVLPQLWLGSQNDARNLAWLRKSNITFVLNVTSDVPNFHEVAVPTITYHRIPIRDSWHQSITSHFDEAHAFLTAALGSGGVVLIHCLAGVSRSATIVIAYLMRINHQSLAEAYSTVKALRPTVSPNLDFMGHLLAWERHLATLRAQTASATCAAPSASLRTISLDSALQ